MAVDSNKWAVLERRLRELRHAMNHEYSEERVGACGQKVIDAVLGVLKKYRPAFFEHADTDEIEEWRALESRWRSMKPTDIPEMTREWPDSPSMRLLRLK
ncbi:MAG: hypothetical protein ACI9R3_002580 [Verrucomicrobiales bacterium]|jgi:hypothetical protein